MAQIKYLDSRRIMGASTDIVENLNYVDENYSSSTGWTQVSTNIAISNGKVQFSSGLTATSRIYKALPFTADNTKWIIDFELLYSTAGNGDQIAPLCISDGTDHPTGSATNSICVHSYHNGAGVTNDTVSVSYRDGGSLTNVFQLGTNLTNGTRYYMRLERTSSTNVKLTAYSNSARTSSVTTNNGTIPSTLDGLTTIHHSSHHTTGAVQTAEIDNLKFYDGVTGTPFTVTYKPKASLSLSGCKAYYNFEQTSGSLTNIATTANGFDDGLGSSADGTVQNITQNATGKLGSYAYTFNGTTSSSKITLGSSYSQFVFLRSGNSTISLWLKKAETSTTSFRTIFAEHYGGGGQSGVRIAVLNNKFNIVVYNSGSNVVVSTTDFDYPQNTDWHHIVVKFDYTNSLMTVYVDGSSLGTKALGSTSSGNSSLYASLGDDQGGDGNWYGDMDDLTLFSRALTSDEVSYLYNSGTGRTVNSTDMLGWTEEA